MSHREKEHVRNLGDEARQRLLGYLAWSRTFRPPLSAAMPAELADEEQPAV